MTAHWSYRHRLPIPPGTSAPSTPRRPDRDGTIIRAIDPPKCAAWSQGDVAHPNTKPPAIAAAVASGVNMNEWVHESSECSRPGAEPSTDAQFEAVGGSLSAHKATGLSINRNTVVVHADVNTGLVVPRWSLGERGGLTRLIDGEAVRGPTLR